MLLPLLAALCLPYAVLSATPCESTKVVLSCQSIPLEDVSKYYAGESMIRLDNVTGNVAVNTTGLSAVNSIIGTRVNLTQQALKDLLSLQHLSTLELRNSVVDLTNGSTIFTNPNLRYLRLIDSLKTPVDFFNFTLLSELDLSGNKLVKIPKIHGEKLAFLNVSSTSIRTVDNLENLPALEELDLSFNGLRGVSEKAFATNQELTKLWLNNNDLREVKFNSTKLTILCLNYNDMEVVKGEFFEGVPQVTNLFLVGNKILEMIEPFKNLPHLKSVDLSDNDLTSLNGSWFEHVPELEVFRASHNDLLELPELHTLLHSLHYLNLSYNSLQALNSNFFKQMPSLATLDITHNQLKSLDGATHQLRELNKLYAAHNFLTVTDKTFGRSEMLNFANLSYNGLSIGPQVFDKAIALRDIDLSHNEITDFCEDGTWPKNIRNLDLSFNKLTSMKCLTIAPSGEVNNKLSTLNVKGNPLRCDQPIPPPVSTQAPMLPADVTVANDSEFDEGDWREVYKNLCPEGATTVPTEKVSTEESPKKDKRPLVNFNPQNVHSVPSLTTYDYVSDESDEDDDEYDDDEDEEEDDDIGEIYAHSPEETIPVNEHAAIYAPLATWVFALLGICLVLLLINLLMFVWYRRRERQDARLGSDRPYEQLHNEVYKNTTTRLEGIHRPMVDVRKYFSNLKNEKLNEMIIKLGLRTQPANDAESQTRMIASEPVV